MNRTNDTFRLPWWTSPVSLVVCFVLAIGVILVTGFRNDHTFAEQCSRNGGWLVWSNGEPEVCVKNNRVIGERSGMKWTN